MPGSLSNYKLEISQDRLSLMYAYDTKASRTGITRLMRDIADTGFVLEDLRLLPALREERNDHAGLGTGKTSSLNHRRNTREMKSVFKSRDERTRRRTCR